MAIAAASASSHSVQPSAMRDGVSIAKGECARHLCKLSRKAMGMRSPRTVHGAKRFRTGGRKRRLFQQPTMPALQCASF